MSSIIEGYNYDIFISYRQKDNRGERWVSDFVEALKSELESTFKEDISIYFDENPHDGLLETYDVDASLKEKLNCLIFIPIISRTYCDPKSFAWEHEFKAFIEQASKDQFGLKVKLANNNVTGRILPIQIHDLNPDDKMVIEKQLAGFLRSIEFIYKEPGVNRPLKPDDDDKINLTKTKYRNQINKVANAIDEILKSLKYVEAETKNEQPVHKRQMGGITSEMRTELQEKTAISPGKRRLSAVFIFAILFIIAALFAYYEIFKKDAFKDIRDAEGKISVAVMPFKNLTGDSLYNKWQDSFQTLLISHLSNTDELSVRSFETMLDIIGRTGHLNYASITPAVAKEIAIKLESGIVVMGSLSEAGGDFRINAQLMKAESSEIYKAFTIDFSGEDKFLTIVDTLSGLLKDFLRIEIIKKKELPDMYMPVNTTSPEAYLCFVQAMKMIFSNNNRAAGEYLFKAIEIDTGFTSCYYFISLGYQQSGDINKARNYLQKAEERKDKLSIRDQLFYDHMKFGYLEKNPQKGLQYLYQLAEKEPYNRFIINNIGDLNRQVHNYKKEIEAYEKYIELDVKWGVTSKWIWPYVELGDAYHITGNHRREAELFDEALQMWPDHPGVIYRQAKCALVINDTIKASAYITRLLTIYSERNNYTDAQLKNVLGNLYKEAGIPKKAEQYFRQSLDLNPGNYNVMNTLALLLIKNDMNIEEGMILNKRVLEKLPENYNFQYTKGLGLFKQGQYTEALDLLNKSWAARPNYDYDHFMLIEAAKKAFDGQK